MRKTLLIAAVGLWSGLATAQGLIPQHALTLLDTPKYPADFKQLDWVNVDAPKGGELRMADFGGFDSLNPFAPKGDPATGLGLTYETLMRQLPDDPNTEYGLIAETVEVPDDLTYAIFNLRAAARWHDGTPITAADVVFSLESLKTKGPPIYRFYYANVAGAEALGERRVKFTFSGPRNRELPQIIGQLPVLQKAYWSSHDVEKTTLEPWVGSGPYKVRSVEPNRAIVYERVVDHWAKDLPIERGQYNFDVIRYESYRDETVQFEAFKSGQYDYQREISSLNWARSYDFPAVKDGRVIKLVIPAERPGGMVGIGMNQRRAMFKDRRVRQAMAMAFDWEWINANLLFNQHTRFNSYFQNTDFAAKGLPDANEAKLLEPLKDQLPPEVFSKEFKSPSSDGSGQDRAMLREATRLLREAGWTVKDQKLVGPDGKQMTIEILLAQGSFERVLAPFVQNLQRLGIAASIRLVDSAQYINRMRAFDFDMALASGPQTSSPGNEQREYWTCAAAKNENSRNISGVCEPAIDALVDKVIFAHDRAELVTASRALDRALVWNWVMVPFSTVMVERIAIWNKFGMPAVHPRTGPNVLSWWIDPAKLAALKAKTP